MDSRWCSESLPRRPSLPHTLKQYDDGWIQLVEDRAPCSEPTLQDYGIQCTDVHNQRTYRFPAGRFGLSQQVWLPSGVAIEGARAPNVPGAPRQRVDLTGQTLFMSTGPDCSGATRASTRLQAGWPTPSPQSAYGGLVKCKRKGFLMNDHTAVRNINGQGLAEDGAGMGAGLNGGAFFELPGCITSYAVRGGCGKQPGEGVRGASYVTGAGKAVAHVLIEDVRLNDLTDGKASLSAFWSGMAPDGAAHRDITFRRIVAMRTERDGINVHGNVVGWTGEDLHFENQGDDVYAVWGGGGGDAVDETGMGQQGIKCGLSNQPATDVTFRRVFAGPGTSAWSSCSHTFGVGRVSYEHMLCCASPAAHPALIVDSSFCASYPNANVTLVSLRWYKGQQNLCYQGGPHAVAAHGGWNTGWKDANLHTAALGCP